MSGLTKPSPTQGKYLINVNGIVTACITTLFLLASAEAIDSKFVDFLFKRDLLNSGLAPAMDYDYDIFNDRITKTLSQNDVKNSITEPLSYLDQLKKSGNAFQTGTIYFW